MFKGWIARDAVLSGRPSVAYLGGMRRGSTGLANWTYPLVRLRFYEDGLELGPSVRILKVIVPIWRVRFQEISVAEALGGPQPDSAVGFGRLAFPFSFVARWEIMSRGVRIKTFDDRFAIFWCMPRDQVLAGLQRQSVNVDLQPQRFHFFSPRS
jgi:hypothetical protein